MNNNIYVRSGKSIGTISIFRILFLLPLIFYGFYKNGIFLFLKKYVSLAQMFRPLVFILGGAFIGATINIIYERFIRKNKGSLFDLAFSSFHVEYGIILGCIVSINTNLAIFFGVISVLFLLSKFIKVRFNIMALSFIVIYFISLYFGEYVYYNAYEASRTFSLAFGDYLVGRGVGGIASSHIILSFIALIGLHLTNNNKTSVALAAIITFLLGLVVLNIFHPLNYLEVAFSNSYLFIFVFMATDSVSSCYTPVGKIVFGVIVGLLTVAFYLVNPIIAPAIAILIVSIFNIMIDRFSRLIAH